MLYAEHNSKYLHWKIANFNIYINTHVSNSASIVMTFVWPKMKEKMNRMLACVCECVDRECIARINTYGSSKWKHQHISEKLKQTIRRNAFIS